MKNGFVFSECRTKKILEFDLNLGKHYNFAAVHLAGLAHALAVYADHLALRAVTHDGGHPFRKAGSERSGVKVQEEAP
jgi:hypothetical protein